MSSSAVDGVILLTPFLLFSLVFVYFGARALYNVVQSLVFAKRVLTTEPVAPDEVPTGGYATVGGSSIPASDGPLTAPLSGQDAVAYRYRIRQQSDGVGWWDVFEDGSVTPFVLEGTASRTMVEPGDVDPYLDTEWETVEVGAGETLPDPVRERLAAAEGVDLDERPELLAEAVEDPRLYAEQRIEPGEELYAFGVSSDGEGAYATTLAVEESMPFGVGSFSPENLDLGRLGPDGNPLWNLVVALLFLAAGLGITYVLGGIWFELLLEVTGR